MKYVLSGTVCRALYFICGAAAGASLLAGMGGGASDTRTEREVIKDRIVTVREEKRPDGTTVTETKTQDKDRVRDAEIKVPKVRNWAVGAGAGLNLELQPVYMLTVDRKLTDNLAVGVWLTTDQSAGVRAVIEF